MSKKCSICAKPRYYGLFKDFLCAFCSFYLYFCNMKKHYALLVLVLLLCGCSRFQRAAYDGDTWAISPGLSNSSITCMLEDREGYVWIGTDRGLNRFNGTEMHQYFHSATDSCSLPHDGVLVLLQDSRNRIWVGTQSGIGIYTDEDKFTQIPTEGHARSIGKIVENSKGQIFIMLVNSIQVYDEEKKRFVNFFVSDNLNTDHKYLFACDGRDILWYEEHQYLKAVDSSSSLTQDSIALPFRLRACAKMINDQIWLTDGEKLCIVDLPTKNTVPLPPAVSKFIEDEHPVITDICPLRDGNLMFITSKGLCYFDHARAQVFSESDASFPYDKPSMNMKDVFEDSKGNLWYISKRQGYQLSSNRKGQFNGDSKLISSFANMPVTGLVMDRNQKDLWIRTNESQLYLFDTRTHELRNMEIQNALADDDVIDLNNFLLYQDKGGFLWMNIRANLLYRLERAGNSLRIAHSLTGEFGPFSAICEDSEGKFWIGGFFSHLMSYKTGDEKSQTHALPDGEFFFPLCMKTLNDKRLAMLTIRGGLFFQTGDKSLPSAFTGALLNSVIQKGSTFHPIDLYEDVHGKLWIATIGNGLICYDPNTNIAKNFPGIACKNACAIQEDRAGHIWVSTEDGISEIDPSTENVKNFHANDGTGGNQFLYNSSCKLPDGTLLFGGIHGLTEVNAGGEQDTLTVPLYFEDLRIFNRLIHPKDNNCIDTHLRKAKEINLAYWQTGFSISFAALEFGNQSRFTYQYKMDGVDRVWVDCNDSHLANFANLSPGTYSFHARIVTNDGSRVLNEISIPVVVHPAPWNSWWAWCCYLLVLAFALWKGITYFKDYRENRALALKAQREKEQELHINQMNMHFFANISHEFRTPLTVISGPLTQLCRNANISGQEKKLLTIINRSVDRMLKLVNQMMDFNRLEEDTLRLNVSYVNIIEPLRNIQDFFSMNASEKNIRLTSTGLEDYFLTWVDVDKLEKMLSNLMGNAMKYTPEGGAVKLSLDVVNGTEASQLFPLSGEDSDCQYLKICVSDTGDGIPVEQREKIFERYYQLENQRQGNYSFGTGIGLYYVRRLVNLHHGFIRVMDGENGRGSCFCLILPVNENRYTDEEKSSAGAEKQTLVYPIEKKPSVAEEANATVDARIDNRPVVMVVDDDIEIVQYLKLLLSAKYKVICRFNATSAFETLQREENIDLVISDVIMPEVSGYQLCKQIKDDVRFSHIPVILVTAKNSVKDQVEGLNNGALAYVTKPFDPDYLLAVILSLLQNRDASRKLLQEGTLKTELDEEDTLTAQDKAFMKELYKLMEEELDNPDMDIVRLTEMMHVSRSKLYYKIKALVGENPASFFKHYKLNRAAEMIREGKYNISEIAQLTGFSNQSYFTACFKKQFGVTPKEYV